MNPAGVDYSYRLARPPLHSVQRAQTGISRIRQTTESMNEAENTATGAPFTSTRITLPHVTDVCMANGYTIGDQCLPHPPGIAQDRKGALPDHVGAVEDRVDATSCKDNQASVLSLTKSLSALSTKETPLIDRHFCAEMKKRGGSVGHAFERWIAGLFYMSYGWKCSVSKGSGDRGVDVFAVIPSSNSPSSSTELKGIIQCKAYNIDRKIEPRQVRDLSGAGRLFGADFFIMATLSRGFSDDTYAVASQHDPLSETMKLKMYGDIFNPTNGQDATTMILLDRDKLESIYRDMIEKRLYENHTRVLFMYQSASECTWQNKKMQMRGKNAKNKRWSHQDRLLLHKYVLEVECEQEKENKLAVIQGRKPKKLDKFIHIYNHHRHEFSIDWTTKRKPHKYLSERRFRDIPFLRRDGVI